MIIVQYKSDKDTAGGTHQVAFIAVVGISGSDSSAASAVLLP